MYYQGYYKHKDEAEIIENIKKEGFDPIRFSNAPSFVYPLHKHPETKLLAFLEGNMEVTIEDKVFNCKKGDKIMISGNIEHSAVVGRDGCVFFWSEKIMKI